jgi:hypothetical protein
VTSATKKQLRGRLIQQQRDDGRSTDHEIQDGCNVRAGRGAPVVVGRIVDSEPGSTARRPF